MNSILKDRSKAVNASFTLAGAACLLHLACQYFCPAYYGGLLHIKGFWYLGDLVIPMLCFWMGMLLRLKFIHPKGWLMAAVAIAAAVEYGIYVWLEVSNPLLMNTTHLRIAVFLTGFAIPWKYLAGTADPKGWKPLILCLLSTLVFCVMNYVSALTNRAESLAQVSVAVAVAWPAALLVPIWFAAEFSLSKAGLWLGAQKWYRWIAGFAAVWDFIGSLVSVIDTFIYPWPFGMALWHWIVFLVQPVTVYLIFLLGRAISHRFVK